MTEYPDDAQYEESYLDDDVLEHENEDGARTTALGAWGVSALIHAVILLILGGIWALQVLEQEPIPTKVHASEPLRPPPEPPQVKEPKDIEPVIDDIEVVVENPTLDAEITMTDVVMDTTEIAQPSEEISQASEMSGATAFIGAGAGSPFGTMGTQGIGRGPGGMGGPQGSGPTRQTTAAVNSALRWFARHQSPNGQWDVDGYPINCTLDGAKCEPGTGHTNSEGDLAVTAYALLCYISDGFDHRRPSRWRKVVQSGIDYLLTQHQQGVFDKRNYTQAIVAMTLAEAYGSSNDPRLKPVVEQAVAVLLDRQTQGSDGYPYGWDYSSGNASRQDTSVSGWCIMALKSAKMAGIDIGQGMEGGKNMVDKGWQVVNEGTDIADPYQDRSGFPYAFSIEGAVKGGAEKYKHGDRTSIGLACGVFLGMNAGDVRLESMANDVMARTFDQQEKSYQLSQWPPNTYYLYYNTLGMFQMGGERWKKWNDACMPLLTTNQEKEGCLDGSWSVTGGFHGADTGRLLHTAYCCLSLQVFYRYKRLMGKKLKVVC